MLRTILFWFHLSAGVTAGLVILVMSGTGVLLTYEKQMIAWLDRSDEARPPFPSAQRRSVDELVAAARDGDPSKTVTNLTIYRMPEMPALATVGQRVVALNPYTGAVLGESAPHLRAFFRTVTSWHRYLGAASDPLRRTLRAVTGWANALFLLIVLGGVYLWLPRRWEMARVRAVALFRRGLRGKSREFNWHNVIGIWSAVPLVVIALGALPISFQWANRAVYQAVGEEPPVSQRSRAGAPVIGGGARGGRAEQTDGGTRSDGGSGQDPTALEPLWRQAEQQVETWRSISARLGGSGPLTFTIDRGTGGQPQMRGTLTVNRATGEVVRWEPFESQSTGRRLRTFLRFAHTGEYFGLTGQTIAGIASLGSTVLVWSGLSLSLRRLRSWKARRRVSRAPQEAPSRWSAAARSSVTGFQGR